MKVVIVGCVAGGATAAARIRRLNEDAEIIAFERTGYMSYANCGLPYYIGGEIKEASKLTLQAPESFWSRYKVKVFVRHEVVNINEENKTVTVHNLDQDVFFEEKYDKLLLAPGAKPYKPEVPGIDNSKIFSLRTVEDTFSIHKFISEFTPKTALILGSGFIGLEMAENLTKRGIKVTLVSRSNQVMKVLDYDMACHVHAYLRKQGVDIRFNTEIVEFSDKDGVVTAKTKSGENISADMVITALGVTPESNLAKKAGLELGMKESILVNERMETSQKDIFAVGDAVTIQNIVTKEPSVITLAGPANKQGRVAADNICGVDSVYKGSLGSSVLKLFDMTVAVTGLNESACMKAGIKYDRTVTVSASHATYYPNAKNMVVKVLFDCTSGKVIGAEIVGFDGADKRIDVLATAIQANMQAAELKELDLAYAPPYSSAKDPVNMAGFIIENLQNKRVKQFHWNDVKALLNHDDLMLLDVRTEAEYQRGHIAGAVNIPLDSLRNRMTEIRKDVPVYVNCQSGLRSYIACRILSQNGFDCYNLSGGFGFYNTVMNHTELIEKGALACGKESE